ncbi:MAG TPA: hypothetical protein PLE24_03795, partial [Chitinispirillaceae bacterium]|nr:hypothetical protein [Chitinispirillaceae bacterium]
MIAAMILAGLVLLYFGAEGLVRGSASLALKFGMTPLMVGLTVAAFGTSSPELVVSAKAAYNGLGDIVVGNVVGSNIFNVAVILGFAALVRPLKVKNQILRTDAPIMIAVSLVLVLFLRDRVISRPEAAILATGIIAYIILSVHLSRKENASADIPVSTGKSPLLDLLFVVAGLGMLIAGSNLL